MVATGRVASLCRYPVKSMAGEDVGRLRVDASGVAGDRAYAVVDRADGKVASAKHPRKWGSLLALQAALVDEPGDGQVPPVAITLPDGSVVRSDRPGCDAALSKLMGRDVALVSAPPAAARYEAVWPAIDGLVPDAFLAGATGQEGGEPLTDLDVAAGAPGTSFVDVAPLHVLTTGTLARLAELSPGASLEWRRFRPNVLVDTGDAAFVETGSTGATIALGSMTASVDLPTMRCVMTTLAHREIAADRSGLQAVAAHNRVDIPGLGTWACARVYAHVIEPATVAVGDPARIG